MELYFKYVWFISEYIHGPKIVVTQDTQPDTSITNPNPKKLVKKKKPLEVKPVTNKNTTVTCHYQYSDFMESPQSSPRVTVKKLPIRKSITNSTPRSDASAEQADYQVVFGPSSLKSSTDGKFHIDRGLMKYAMRTYACCIIMLESINQH